MCSIAQTAPFELFGSSITVEQLGGVRQHLHGLLPIESLDRLQARVDALDDGAMVEVAVRCERVILEFPALAREPPEPSAHDG